MGGHLVEDHRRHQPHQLGAAHRATPGLGAYGHRVKKSLAFASVEPAFEAPGSTFEVLLQGESRRATVLPAPAFDADNARMRV